MRNFEDWLIYLEQIEKEYQRICQLLTYQEVLLDKNLCINLEKQKQKLEKISQAYQEYKNLFSYRNNLQDELADLSGEEKNLYLSEIENISKKIFENNINLEKMLSSFDGCFDRIVVEISADTDCKLFADIVLGYTNFCAERDLDCNVLKDLSFSRLKICGINCKKFFSDEIGTHKSENNLCQVCVYDDFEEKIFDEKDTKISVCRSSGAGGQHINKTETAVQITHTKTGLTAICQDERSQFQNKEKALERLKEKVENFYSNQKEEFFAKQKKKLLPMTKQVVKVYDYQKGIITTKRKQKIFLEDFLKGKII